MESLKENKFFGFQWHITNYCNLRCRHCYQDDFTERDDLGLNLIENIVKKISDSLNNSKILINLTGGEPLLRKDFYSILALLERVSNIQTINIITNGLLLNKETIRRLNDYRKIKEIKISLEGGDGPTNDAVRGRGVFNKVIKVIEDACEISNKEIILMFTLGSYNYKNLDSMLGLAPKTGVSGVIIERFVPLGKGRLLQNQYLKRDEWYDVIKSVISFAGLDYTPKELLPYKAFHIEMKRERELKGAYCNLGDGSMALMPNGDVFPCRRFPTKIGNILSDNFGEILLRLSLLRDNIINNLKGRCRDCPIEGCLGCRAIAYAINNDFCAEDPQCFL